MKIPKKIIKDNKKYTLIKIYKNYALYRCEQTNLKECFMFQDLGEIKEAKKIKEASKFGNVIF